jgi:hypothetical protein
VPIQRRISDFKPLFTNLAQTSHYEVRFGGLHPRLTSYLGRKGISSRFIAEDAGLLCHSAVLPTTQLATANITGNFMGITEKFAHTRQYNEISLDFYVDRNYNAIKFMESWMEFIASGSNNPIDSALQPISQNRTDYISRMQYPEYYKSNSTKITKFDRDYGQEIEYSFIGLFPYQIASIPVTYASSEVLKMTAVFQYDRYIAGKSLSLNEFNQDNNNNQSNQSPNPFVSTAFQGNPFESPISAEDAFRIGNNLDLTSFGVNSNTFNTINFSE